MKINSKEKSESGSSASVDGRHDTFDYEQAEREQRMIVNQIDKKMAALNKVVLIERHGDEELIDIGDYVVFEVIFDGCPSQDKVVKLTGSFNLKIVEEIHEITINSLIGKAIYRKKVMEKIEYKANGKKAFALIKNKFKRIEEIWAHENSKFKS